MRETSYSQTRPSVLPKNQDLVLLFKIWIHSSFELLNFKSKTTETDFSSQVSISIIKFASITEQKPSRVVCQCSENIPLGYVIYTDGWLSPGL